MSQGARGRMPGDVPALLVAHRMGAGQARALALGTGLTETDGGAGGSYTLSLAAILATLAGLANGSGVLTNDGAGALSWAAASGGLSVIGEYEVSGSAVSSFDIEDLTGLDSCVAWLIFSEIYNSSASNSAYSLYLAHGATPTYEVTAGDYDIQSFTANNTSLSGFRNNNAGWMAVNAGLNGQSFGMLWRYDAGGGTKYTGGVVVAREHDGSGIKFNLKAYDSHGASGGVSEEPVAIRMSASIASSIGVGSRCRILQVG